jgi:hypothetical protein
MSPADYKNTIDLMNAAGNDADPKASGETERSLILKAVAARASRYENPTPQDLIAKNLGVTTGAQLEVSAFAAGIRGMDRDQLVRKTSTIDLNSDNRNDALKQKFVNGCAPAVVQIARAEADPAYALILNQENIGGTDPNSLAGAEQGAMLLANGVTPVTNGSNHSGIELSRVLGGAAPFSGQAYQHTAVADDPASRRAALDKIDQALQRGQDVPLSTNLKDFGDHAVIFTDVRKTAEGREFLFTDPFTGRSDWVKEADLVNGNADLAPN